MAGENWNCGPPLSAMNDCPSSSKDAPIILPSGPGIRLVTRAFLKIDV